MLKAIRSRSTIATVAPIAQAASTPSQLVPAFLEARFVRPAQPIAVTFAKPVEHGRPELLTGNLVGTMHARGAIHHHRVNVAGVLWLVPPVWLTPASAKAMAVQMAPKKALSGDAYIMQLVQDVADAWGIKL